MSLDVSHLEGPCTFQLAKWDDGELNVESVTSLDVGEGRGKPQLQKGHLCLARGYRVAEDQLRTWEMVEAW